VPRPGRARRRSWWLVAVVAPLAVSAVGRALAARLEPVASPVAWLIWALVLPQAWVTVARLHDRGLSGWWAAALAGPTLLFGLLLRLAPDRPDASALYGQGLTVLSLVGLPALLALVVLCGVLPGERGPNRFGPDQRAHPPK
jgi:uncharacterized membrane protein YhaH (DUF805 family)